jgi:hypothetical protein
MIGWSYRNALNRYKNLVLIETYEGQNWAISPDDPEGFIKTVQECLKVSYGK